MTEAERTHAWGARIKKSLVVIVAVTATTVLAGGGASAEPLAQPSAPFSPIHWWTADGTARDAVGNDHGTPLNGAGYATGVRGQAFDFNGAGAEYRFDEVGGNFGSLDFTLTFFIRTMSSQQQAIWEKRPVCDAASFWGFRMSFGIPGAELMSDATGRDYTSFSSGRNVGDGAWHHVALVRTGTSATIYVDGEPAASTSTSHPVTLANAVPLRAGMSACTGVDGTMPFNGELDELMIFEHALTQAEIQAVIGFLREPPPPPPPPARCLVPRVIGLKLGRARTRIRRANCSLGRIHRKRSRRVGRVIGQSPRPGTVRRHGARVNLIVGRR